MREILAPSRIRGRNTSGPRGDTGTIDYLFQHIDHFLALLPLAEIEDLRPDEGRQLFGNVRCYNAFQPPTHHPRQLCAVAASTGEREKGIENLAATKRACGGPDGMRIELAFYRSPMSAKLRLPRSGH